MQYSEQTNARSVFTDILEGKIPGVILVTTESFFVILTNKPTHPGHTLLIPKRCGVQFVDFNRDELFEYALLKQLIIKSLQKVYCTPENGKKIGEHVSGFEIKNHYHIHFIPAERGAQVTLQGANESGIEERQVEAHKIKVAIGLLKNDYLDMLTFQ